MQGSKFRVVGSRVYGVGFRRSGDLSCGFGLLWGLGLGVRVCGFWGSGFGLFKVLKPSAPAG